MLAYSSLIGAAGAYTGYDLARGNLLGVAHLSDILAGLNDLFGLGLSEQWDSSISASMVLMTFFFFLAAWIFSPKYGLVSTMIRRRNQRRSFNDQVVLGHIHRHQGTAAESDELTASTLYRPFPLVARQDGTHTAPAARPQSGAYRVRSGLPHRPRPIPTPANFDRPN